MNKNIIHADAFRKPVYISPGSHFLDEDFDQDDYLDRSATARDRNIPAKLSHNRSRPRVYREQSMH